MDIFNVLRSILADELKLREAFIKAAEYHKTEHRMYYDCQYMASISDDNIKIIREMAGSSGNEFSYTNESVSVTDDYYPGVNLMNDLEYMLTLKRHNTEKMNLIMSSSTGTEQIDTMLTGIFNENSGRQAEWLGNMIHHVKKSVSSQI